MKYTGPVYRPPFESQSLLLQATVGCSHNKCTFCSMYQDVPFKTESIEQIENDLKEASASPFKKNRIFLVNADAFVLSASRLKEIGLKVQELYPSCETISMYASINNIKNKTDEELRELRALNFNDFNIGIESGCDRLVSDLNKGHTVAEAKEQLLRLKKAGFDYSINIIIGGAGAHGSDEHIQNSIEFINETEPRLIFVANLHVDPGTPLYTTRSNGDFIENTLRMNIQESMALIKGITADTIFFGLHTSNVIPVYGSLPLEKELLLQKLSKGMNQIPSKLLDSIPSKGNEGNIII